MPLTIGIRELRQHASRYIRRVRAGETITITDRGEPVAELKPLPKHESAQDRLVRERRVRREEGDLMEFLRDHPPLAPKPGEPPPSEILRQLREHER